MSQEAVERYLHFSLLHIKRQFSWILLLRRNVFTVSCFMKSNAEVIFVSWNFIEGSLIDHLRQIFKTLRVFCLNLHQIQMPTKWRGNKDVRCDITWPLFVYEENKIWQGWFLFLISDLISFVLVVPSANWTRIWSDLMSLYSISSILGSKQIILNKFCFQTIAQMIICLLCVYIRAKVHLPK